MTLVLAFAGAENLLESSDWLRSALHDDDAVALAPDGSDHWFGPICGLGHALLHDGHDTPSAQPLSLDRKTWISADARLDDRSTLIHALRSQGCEVPQGIDDARLILESYLLWGEDCLTRLRGDFAFAIWDARTRSLFCARDQFGAVPLYYALHGDELLASNSLRALERHQAVSDELDDHAVGDFLLVGFPTDAAATIYKSIRQVPAAHQLLWRDGRTAITRYWNVPEWNGFLSGRPADIVAQFRECLQAAVKDRMRSASVGLQLSGGLDSTSIAALACRNSGAVASPSLRAYTATIHSISADREGEFAAQVAAALQLPVEWIDIDGCPDIDPLASPSFHPPTPTQYQRTSLESEFATRPAKHCRTVLTGLGGDVLLGYNPAFWLDWLKAGQWTRAAAGYLNHFRAFRQLPVPGVRSAIRHRRRTGMGASIQLPPWIDAEFAKSCGLVSRISALRKRMYDLDVASGLSENPQWADLLACGHPSFTGVPVRFRHPFFDVRLVEFITSIPPRSWLQDKHLLREATRDLLPEKVRRRPKTPLVEAPAKSLQTSRGAQANIAEMIESSPCLDRFINRKVLGDCALAGSLDDKRNYRSFGYALGLAHWLQHRRREKASFYTRASPNLVGPRDTTCVLEDIA